MRNFQDEQSPLFLNIVQVLRDQQLSKRTEQKYVFWIKKFIYFHRERHPKTLHEKHIQDFLTHLALRLEVSSCTQNIAFKAVLFMFQQVLNKPIVESRITLYKVNTSVPQNVAA